MFEAQIKTLRSKGHVVDGSAIDHEGHLIINVDGKFIGAKAIHRLAETCPSNTPSFLWEMLVNAKESQITCLRAREMFANGTLWETINNSKIPVDESIAKADRWIASNQEMIRSLENIIYGPE